MKDDTYNYNVEILLLNNDYTWTPVGFFVAQKAEDVGALAVKSEYLDKIEQGLNDPDDRFFSIENMIFDSITISGVMVKVKEQKD